MAPSLPWLLDRNDRDLTLRATRRDLDYARAAVDHVPFHVLHRQRVVVVAVREREAGFILAVPQQVGRRGALAAERADRLRGLVHERQRPALGIALRAGIQVDLGDRLLAGRREDGGLGLRAREEAAEPVREAEPVRQAQRVIHDAVVELVL